MRIIDTSNIHICIIHICIRNDDHKYMHQEYMHHGYMYHMNLHHRFIHHRFRGEKEVLVYFAWVTRPERPKGAKDEVKRPEGPPP